MKRIDKTTLESVAELICGAGQGSGGGYGSLGPYRTMGEIQAFFDRAGVEPHGQSSTRKWFVLESLESINGTSHLEKVLLRLASPKEYRGDADVLRQVLVHLNRSLQIEGFQVDLNGVEPHLREREASVYAPDSQATPLEPAPDFQSIVKDSSLAEVL